MKKDDGISMVRTSTHVDGYIGTVTHAHDWQPTPMLRVIDGEFQQLHRCVCGEQQWTPVRRMVTRECKECNGYGFVTITEIHGNGGTTYSKQCQQCNGKGFIEEDV